MQYSIYKEIKERFDGHLWLDVVSKADLLRTSPVIYATEDRDLTQHELEKYRKSGPDGAINVSVTTEEGIHEVRKIYTKFSEGNSWYLVLCMKNFIILSPRNVQ